MGINFKYLLTVSALGLVLSGCAQKSDSIAEKGTALPPPTVNTQSKGLNLASPTMPDKDDMKPNPAPMVEEAQVNEVAAAENVLEAETTQAMDETMMPSESHKPVMLDNVQDNEMPAVDQRLANLEAAVASLRADYDRIVPTFKTLSVNSDRLAALLDRMEGKVASAPAQDTSEVPAQTAPAAGAQMTAAINDVRFGHEPNKTRIVFDMSGAGEYLFDLDNTEKVFIVSMPTASWGANKSGGAIKSSAIFESWSVQDASESGGVNMIFTLKKDSAITGRAELPSADGKGPRIYFDISGV